ncbi:hypothetical protein FGO68_gene15877 [Halteria grandinella]|uniref:TLDc domain-containing protein n=1 Tax=Halteria grandinella TaxID=5974 RepID=A0A8J8T720_HALGN|nr:hypothetical protein FGO68_gene15877 [Halteria grandinella]
MQIDSNANSTTLQAIIQHQENLEECNCGSQEKVMFYCDEQKCPSFAHQRLFCPSCMRPDKHPHAPVFIAIRNKNVSNEWNQLRQEVVNLKQKIINWMSIHEPLSLLLDEFIINPEISLWCKYNHLKILGEDIEAFYQINFAELSIKGEILKLQELNNNLNGFRERLKQLEFLNKIGPIVLWMLYSDAIPLVSHQIALQRLSLPNYEVFIKLRLYKMQMSLNYLLKDQKVDQEVYLRILENPEESNEHFIQKMCSKLKSIANTDELNISNALQIGELRSELDSIATSQMLISIIQKMKEQEQSTIDKFNERILGFEESLRKLSERLINQTKQNKKYSDNLVKSLENRLQIKQAQERNHVDQLRQNFESFKLLNSKILKTETQQNQMRKFFEQAGRNLSFSQLLYRGSQHSFSASSFHKFCDNKPFTLTIIQTSQGVIMGGYTEQSWEGEDNYKQDQNAWLFNIEEPKIFKVNDDGKFAIVTNQSFGPTFGGGYDLHISDDCNSKYQSYIDCDTYNGFSKGKQLLRIEEIEVFSV